jgi:phosphatidylglycerophosphate synthase
MSEFQHATRQQTSLLSPLEKKALLWLAANMPPWINSDHLTALGFLSMAAAGFAYWYSAVDRVTGLLLVGVFLLLNWFGDSLDGTVARQRNLQRPRYGFYIDHILDSIGAVFLIGGLGLSGLMSPPIAAALLIAYLLLSIEAFLTTYTIGKFQINAGAFSPTELRVLLIIGNACIFWRPMVDIFGRQYKLYDVGGACGTIGMLAVLLYFTVTHTVQLYREETKW